MAFVAILLFVAFVVLFFYSMHIALPHDICDRRKLQVIEFLLRLSNEHLVCFVLQKIKKKKFFMQKLIFGVYKISF